MPVGFFAIPTIVRPPSFSPSYLEDGHGGLGDVASLRLYHLVYDPVIHRLLGRHEEVPVAVGLDLVLRLPAVLGDVRVEDLAYEEYLLRLYLDVGRLSLRPPQRLVDHDPRVGERAPLPRCSGTEEERAHRRRHSEAHRRDVAGDVLHSVVYRHAGANAPPRAVDVQRDVLGRILVRQVKELRDQDVRDVVVDPLSQQDDPIL